MPTLYPVTGDIPALAKSWGKCEICPRPLLFVGLHLTSSEHSKWLKLNSKRVHLLVLSLHVVLAQSL